MNRIRLVLAMLTLLLPGCYCWEAAHVREPKCVVAHQVVDCTVNSITSLAPSLIGVFTGLIRNGQMNWDQVAQSAEGMAFKDAGCFLGALENDFLKKASASPLMAPKAKMVSDGFIQWKMKNNALGVKFKFKTEEGKEVLR